MAELVAKSRPHPDADSANFFVVSILFQSSPNQTKLISYYSIFNSFIMMQEN